MLDEAAVSKYGAGLRAALGLPAEPFAAAPSLRWACDSNGTDGAAAEAAVWRNAKAMGAYAGARDGAPAVFVHVPKTAGTSLNLVLAKAAKKQKRSFCEVTFRDLDDAARRAALARSCAVFSAETDVSVLPFLGVRRAKAFTFLRDPLRRVASQYEHHLAGGRVASDAAKRVDVLRLASPAPGQDKRAKFPTSKAPFSAVFHSFRLIFGRAIISRNGLEAWMLFLGTRARGTLTLKRR